jgi:hypothetical protein
MRVLVATRSTQGEYEGDYSSALDGELVRLPFVECSRPQACGCGRGFAGITSHRATTTAEVVDRPELTPAIYAEVLWDDFAEQCRAIGISDPSTDGELRALAADDVGLLELIASEFPLGAIVRRDGTQVFRHSVDAT